MVHTPALSLEEFRAKLRAFGHEPSENSLRDMYAALPHLDALCARLRRDYDPADEPAHVFDAEGGHD